MNKLSSLYRVRLADGAISAGDVTPMMCFPIGEWHSAKYPDLPLTEDLANELIANFEAGVLGTEPVVDSSGKHDTSAPAAGWVKRVYLASYEEGDVTGLALWADVKWTALGAELLADERYKYGSVEIGSVVLNDSGETVDNVLRSLTLTNTPVLRLMPGVQNAAAKQRDIVTLSLSEFSLTTEDPDGNPVEPIPASSDGSSQPAKADEGQPETLAEGDAAPKGSDHMRTVALRLSLAEDASEETILAAVTTLAEHDAAETERANAAEAKLAERDAAERKAAVERTLAELVEGGHLLPGQKDEMLALAEDSPSGFNRACAVLKTTKAIDLSERGSDAAGQSFADASVELDEKSKDMAKAEGITLSEAQLRVLAADEDLARRYRAFRMNKKEA